MNNDKIFCHFFHHFLLKIDKNATFPEKGDKKSVDINLLEKYSDSSLNIKYFDNKFLFTIFPLSTFLLPLKLENLIMEK